MDAVTYPDDRVQRELSAHWVTAKLDVAARGAVAAAIEVSGVPAAVALSPEGLVLGRVLGFVPPELFERRLVELRDSR